MKYNEDPLESELTISLKIQEFEAELEIRDSREEKGDEFLYWKADQTKQIKDLFDVFINQLEKENKYYYGCSFPLYKETYLKRKGSFLEVFPDATEVDFISEELTTGAKIIPYAYLHPNTEKRIKFSLNKRLEYLTERLRDNKFELKHYPANKYPEFEYLEHFELIQCNTSAPINHITPIKCSFTQTEILELVRALIATGKIDGNIEVTILKFSQFFQVDINNPDQLWQSIKSRKNGGETIFLDDLKSTLLNSLKR